MGDGEFMITDKSEKVCYRKEGKKFKERPKDRIKFQ